MPLPPIDDLKIDHQKLIADIIASDDGREPMDKARHNMLDPTPLEVLDFVCAGFDDIDEQLRMAIDLAELQAKITNALSENADKIEYRLSNLERMIEHVANTK